MPEMESPQDPREMNIEIDEETAEGTYTNLVMISHTPEEFILDFIRMIPGVQSARVKHRVIVTPSHAKRILGALEENVERYEQMHGEIDPPEGGSQRLNFGGTAGEA